MALSLFGVTVSDTHVPAAEGAPATVTVAIRDLAAVCGQAEYRPIEPSDEQIARHDEVVSNLAARGPVLPAPIGIVFRSAESVERWLELHYGALTDALSFVANRVAARVHIRRPATDGTGSATTIDLDAVAAESLRVLRESAINTLPLRVDKTSSILVSAAFLVEQDLWTQFTLEVKAQAELATLVQFELTGPWPPYDFVQMQLGD